MNKYFKWQVNSTKKARKPSIHMLSRIIKAEIAKIHAKGFATVHSDNKGMFCVFPDNRKEYIKLYWTQSEILAKKNEILAIARKYGISKCQVAVKEFEIGEECEVYFQFSPDPDEHRTLEEELQKLLLVKVIIIKAERVNLANFNEL